MRTTKPYLVLSMHPIMHKKVVYIVGQCHILTVLITRLQYAYSKIRYVIKLNRVKI